MLGGLGVLASRDAVMIASGSLRRLRVVPGVLLAAEPARRGRHHPGDPRLARPGPDPRQHDGRAATVLAAATFTIHACREAIYLSAGHGRR